MRYHSGMRWAMFSACAFSMTMSAPFSIDTWNASGANARRKAALRNDAFDVRAETEAGAHRIHARVPNENHGAGEVHAAIHGFQDHVQQVVQRAVRSERLGHVANAGGQCLLRSLGRIRRGCPAAHRSRRRVGSTDRPAARLPRAAGLASRPTGCRSTRESSATSGCSPRADRGLRCAPPFPSGFDRSGCPSAL